MFSKKRSVSKAVILAGSLSMIGLGTQPVAANCCCFTKIVFGCLMGGYTMKVVQNPTAEATRMKKYISCCSKANDAPEDKQRPLLDGSVMFEFEKKQKNHLLQVPQHNQREGQKRLVIAMAVYHRFFHRPLQFIHRPLQ